MGSFSGWRDPLEASMRPRGFLRRDPAWSTANRHPGASPGRTCCIHVEGRSFCQEYPGRETRRRTQVQELRIQAEALDLLRKTRRSQLRERGTSRRFRQRIQGTMRMARRASTGTVPSFLQQLVRETEKMVTFFFKGGQREKRDGEDSESEDESDDVEEIISPYLERPVLQKGTAEGDSKYGVSSAMASMQGWRAQMEDTHTCMPEMSEGHPDWSYFAVFDGHAGTTVAQYCSTHLLDHILATGAITAEENVEQVKEGIRDGFLAIDRHMHNLSQSEGWDRSGSTAASVIISPNNIYFINCGDSRTFLCRDGQVVFHTEDHKPCNPREKERIQNAGGSVTLQRVNGSLAVSRALGDFAFKEVEWRTQTEQLVSPEPEVYELERSPQDEFLVVACDGVWDAISNEELCAFVRNRLQVCDDLRDVCTQVIDLCLYKGSLDNMSIIIICFSGAPQVTPEALQQEADLERRLDLKVDEIIQVIRSKGEDPDLLYVMKFLASENVPGLPPGGGVTSKRDCVIAAYQKYAAACRTVEPMDIGGSEDSN